jgi:transcription elongation factor GreA
MKLGMISISSPLARALIGKVEGDVASFTVPAGEKNLEIVRVEYF